jgi:hypothetical protein
VDELRAKIKARDEKEKTEALWKAKKKLTIEVNRAKNKLKAAGIQARKDKQARLQRLVDYATKNEFPPVKDLLRIREPDKEPTQLELATCTEEHYPELVLAIQQIKGLMVSQASDSNGNGNGNGNSDDDDNGIRIMVVRQRSPVLIPDYKDSSPPLPVLIDSSYIESDAGSIDSI